MSLLKSINQPQASDQNLNNLRELGGVEGLLSKLKTNAETGIQEQSVLARRKALGYNSLPSAPRATFWQLFMQTFEDATLQILIVAALVSLAIGIYDDPATGYVEGLAILAAVLIVSTVTAANDFQKESQFRELTAADDENSKVVVLRSGEAQEINVVDVVVGDLFSIEAGSQIPCDGVLVRKNEHLEVDESALTGEPMDIDKDPQYDPFLLSGSICTAGSGQIVAIAVGKDSQWGIIKSHLEKEQEHTPLQEKLDDMAAKIGYVGMAAAAATFVAMMMIKLVVKPDYLANVSIFNHALDAFIIGVTIVVVAVPEGLPLAVTISLAFSTKKMLADQNLIRHLAACETMGNATNICSDKTGTLTENRMTVVRGVFANLIETNSNPNAVSCCSTENAARETLTTPELPKHPPAVSDIALEILLEGIACCSTARVVVHEDEEVEFPHRPHVIGNKTEAALLILAQSPWGKSDDTDARRARARFGEPGGSRLFPFSSARKRMSVLVKHDGEGDATPRWTLYHKGAAEIILENCTTFLDRDGSEHVLTPAKRKEFEAHIHEYASDALRCVALCHRSDVHLLQNVNLSEISMDQCAELLENNMCLDALVGIADPLREDVIDAVATCQNAGIFVRMVTGDNLETAIAIAKQAGILTEGMCMRVESNATVSAHLS
jgi:magnesium-transporting ATPase (P-type)